MGWRAFLARRRRRRQIIAAICIALLGIVIAMDRAGVLEVERFGPDELTRYDGQSVRVARVIDGDTFDVDEPDGEQATTRVRLWGVDTPETAWPEQGRDEPEPFAEEATRYTRELIEGRTVTLRLEPQRVRGRYGRLLAHVELADGRLLNELLIEQGLAESETRWPHDELDRYEAAQTRAREARRGMWGE